MAPNLQAAQSNQHAQADLIFTNAKIYDHKDADAIAIRDGNILFIFWRRYHTYDTLGQVHVGMSEPEHMVVMYHTQHDYLWYDIHHTANTIGRDQRPDDE